jgi:hypothetical protein
MQKAEIYDRYPISSVVIYNGSTILHFLTGGLILLFLTKIIGFSGIAVSALYIVLAFLEMYVIMPLKVCPSCVYFRTSGSLCISGLNVWSKMIAKPGNSTDFPQRAQGLFCQNNLYITSLVFPILLGVLILILKFNLLLLFFEIGLFLLLVLRFFLIIPSLACVHCRSKFVCPQAGQMGVREK